MKSMKYLNSTLRNPKVWLLTLASLMAGCEGLYFLNADKKQKVPAECDKLGGQKVAIVAWAEPSTLDMDPEAPYRVASIVAYFLDLNSGKKQLKGMSLVDCRKIVEWQEKQGTTGTTMSNADVAKAFGADVVMRIDLFDYTTRAPEANGLVMGRVGANVALQRASEAEPLYRTEISASFPEDSRTGVLDRSDGDVLNETLQRFGDALARKFYAHETAYK